jgi:hypothetical protein
MEEIWLIGEIVRMTIVDYAGRLFLFLIGRKR